MVRLMACHDKKLFIRSEYFNSYMVRLMDPHSCFPTQAQSYFNSYMVRLMGDMGMYG